VREFKKYSTTLSSTSRFHLSLAADMLSEQWMVKVNVFLFSLRLLFFLQLLSLFRFL
jgi:hypothetical protein